MEEELRDLFVAAICGALPVTEQNVGPRRDARDLLANNVARPGRGAQASHEIEDVLLRCFIITPGCCRQPFDPAYDRQCLLARHSSSQVVAPVATEVARRAGSTGCDAPS